jgi:hypothetical protein
VSVEGYTSLGSEKRAAPSLGTMPMSIEDEEPHPLDDEKMESDVEEKKKDKKKDSKKKSRRLVKSELLFFCMGCHAWKGV